MAEPGSCSHFCQVLLVLLVPCTQLCWSLGNGAATLEVGAADAGLPYCVPSSGLASLGILAADNTQVCLSVIIAQRHRDPSHSRLHALEGGGHFANTWLMQAEKVLPLLSQFATTLKGHFSSRVL